MIDHDYQIITREVIESDTSPKHFIAELSRVHITVNGERTKAQYPKQAFEATTQIEALLQANDAVRDWLKDQDTQDHSQR